MPFHLIDASRTKRLARDVYELLEHLAWDRFHLVGLSMGGMIALELSFMVMPRIKSLSLLVTHSGGLTGIVSVRIHLSFFDSSSF